MPELLVSASDFRVHLKDLANDVAAGRERVVMARHGYPIAGRARKSAGYFNFLRRYKPATVVGDKCASDGSGPPDALAGPAAATQEAAQPHAAHAP